MLFALLLVAGLIAACVVIAWPEIKNAARTAKKGSARAPAAEPDPARPQTLE
jgi:hypothetical protein